MIDELRSNIESEMNMLREIVSYERRIQDAGMKERKMLEEVVGSLTKRMRILNNSIPEIIKNISINKRLLDDRVVKNLEKIEVQEDKRGLKVVLNKKDKDEFISELNIGKKNLERIKNFKEKKSEENDLKKPRKIVKFSNMFFFRIVEHLTKSKDFDNLKIDLRKANIDLLLESYLSLTLLSACIALVLGLLGSIGVMTLLNWQIGMKIIFSIFLVMGLPAITLFLFYIYPSVERDSIAKKVEQELPFAVIHMSAISGSGIEPSQIFKIIGTSGDYPNLRKEIRKVLNQINLYGYDLVTALNHVSRSTPSKKLSELLLGLSATISSGGQLQSFFEKRAETLLLSYRLEREKFTKMAETFMDIYITVVIAAPMILLLIFILLSVGDFNIGISPGLGTFLLIVLISIINIVFLGVVHLKQPTY